MNTRSNLPSFSVAFGGPGGFSCQADTTNPQFCYQGITVQTLNSPCSAYLNQSNADQNNTHTNPLTEFRVTSLTQAVPDSFDESDLTVIPESIHDEYTPCNSDNESVDDEQFPILSSYPRNQSCFSEIEPDIRESTSANRINLDNHLTNLPAELAYPQDSRPVAVVNPLSLQEATSDNPVKSAKIVADKSLQAKRKRERYQNDPAYAKRKKELQRERYRNDPAHAKRKREYYREHYRNDPTYAKRKKELQKERYRNDPAYAKRIRERCKKSRLRREPKGAPEEALPERPRLGRRPKSL